MVASGPFAFRQKLSRTTGSPKLYQTKDVQVARLRSSMASGHDVLFALQEEGGGSVVEWSDVDVRGLLVGYRQSKPSLLQYA